MSQDENELFQEQMKGIKPLSKTQQRAPEKRNSNIADLQNKRDWAIQSTKVDKNYLVEHEVEFLKPDSWLEYKKSGIQEGVYRKLRLGKYPIQDTLDLHRVNIRKARQLVWEFVHQSIKNDFRMVRIIHGKGELSQPQAQMKSFVAAWLNQFTSVIAFHSAQPKHGGLGAVYVLLKKSEAKKQQSRELNT